MIELFGLILLCGGVLFALALLALFGGALRLLFQFVSIPLSIVFWVVKAVFVLALAAVGIALFPVLLLVFLLTLPFLLLCGIGTLFAAA